jgi:hypothetical protein
MDAVDPVEDDPEAGSLSNSARLASLYRMMGIGITG